MASTFNEQGVYEMNHGKIHTAIKSFTKAIENDKCDEQSYILRSQCYVR